MTQSAVESFQPQEDADFQARSVVEWRVRFQAHFWIENAGDGRGGPNPTGREVVMDNPRGTVCWNLQAQVRRMHGPRGSQKSVGFLNREKLAEALIIKTERDRTGFPVNDRNFADNEGFFEFEAALR